MSGAGTVTWRVLAFVVCFGAAAVDALRPSCPLNALAAATENAAVNPAAPTPAAHLAARTRWTSWSRRFDPIAS